ncbi:MAG: hypothetical protein IKS52_09260 [Clostridia bacterium]|nr:hypothetical protein [Clostridia bacterium]
MFAVVLAAGFHHPGSLNAFPIRYSFLHRLFIYLHYSGIHAACQAFRAIFERRAVFG